MRVSRMLVVLVAAACGASTANVQKGKAARYQTDHVSFWNEVAEAVKERYPQFARADREEIVTSWFPVTKEAGTQETDPAFVGGVTVSSHWFFRLKVRWEGGPPWQVVIDGEAALVKEGEKYIQPIPHRRADEPAWVQTRIDDMYARVYSRLKHYDTESKAKTETAPSPGNPPY